MALTISASNSELPQGVNNVLERTFLERAIPKLTYLIGHKPTTFKGGQDTNVVKWRRIDEMDGSTTALAEQTGDMAYGMGRSATTLSDSTVTATMAKYGQFVSLSEEVEIFQNPMLMDEIADVLGEAAGKSINALQRNVVEGGTTVRYAGGVASDGLVSTKLVLNDIKYVVNALNNNNARKFNPMTTGSTNTGTTPLRASYWGICHVDVEEDLRGMAGFASVETYASQTNTVMGEVGAVYGVRFVSTTEATNDAGVGAASAASNGLNGTSDNTDVYSTMIFGKDFHGAVGMGKPFPDGITTVDTDVKNVEMIIKGRGSGGTSDPFDEVSTMAYKFWHAGKILDARFGREIRSGAGVL